MIASNNVAFLNTKDFPWAEKFIEENGLGKKVGLSLEDNDYIYPLYEFNIEKITVSQEEEYKPTYLAKEEL